MKKLFFLSFCFALLVGCDDGSKDKEIEKLKLINKNKDKEIEKLKSS